MASEDDDLTFAEKLFRLPATRAGWWATGLAAAFVALFGVMTGSQASAGVLPAGMLPVIAGACGLGGGAAGATAIATRGERSMTVFLAVLVGVFVLMEVLEGAGRH